jgi:hypothetical protein
MQGCAFFPKPFRSVFLPNSEKERERSFRVYEEALCLRPGLRVMTRVQITLPNAGVSIWSLTET